MGAPSVTTTVTTRFADLDPLGHVNNVTFFEYMETGRVRFMDRYRGSLGRVLVARSECDHKGEIGRDVRSVDVTVSVEAVGRTSVTLRHVLVAGGVEVAVGRVVVVKVDDAHRPVPVTQEERARLLGVVPGQEGEGSRP